MRNAVKRWSGLLALGLCAVLVPSAAFAFDADTSARVTEQAAPLLPASSLSAFQARNETSAGDAAGIAASQQRQKRKERGAKHGAGIVKKLGGGARAQKIGGRIGHHLMGSKTSHKVAGHLLNHALNQVGF